MTISKTLGSGSTALLSTPASSSSLARGAAVAADVVAVLLPPILLHVKQAALIVGWI